MSNLINTQNLTNLRRHLNGISALSEMMKNVELPMVINKMLYLDENSDPMDIMQAFELDLGSTAQMLKNTAIVMTSIDKNGISKELSDKTECDFKKLFPYHYDAESQVLRIFGVSIHANKSQQVADDWKAELYRAMLTGQQNALPYNEYRKNLSLLKTLQSTQRPASDAPLHNSLHYATMLVSVDRNQAFYQSLMQLAGKYASFRRTLDESKRFLLDERIVGSRAMVDGVVKASTYLAPGEIIQLSSKHKADFETVQKIIERLKKTPCVSHIEIDQDADIIKAHDMLVDIEQMSLDVPDAFILKIRRMGNYGVCGLSSTRDVNGAEILTQQFGFSSSQLKIVAVDVDYPTSIAHEIVHFRDQDRTDPVRADFIKHFSEKMDIDLLSEIVGDTRFGVNYFTKPAEVLARMGEIGFLLNQHRYSNGESLSNFIERVKSGENDSVKSSGKLKYNVNLVKPIETYLGENSEFQKNVYFNLSDWTPEELEMVRDYTGAFFYKQDPSIRKALEARIANGEFSALERTYRRQKSKKQKKTRPLTDSEKISHVLAKMAPSDLVSAYKKMVEQDLIADGELPLSLINTQTRLFDGGGAKTVGEMSNKAIVDQFNEVCELANAAIHEKRPIDSIGFACLLEESLRKDFAQHLKKIINTGSIKYPEEGVFSQHTDLANQISSLMFKGQDLDGADLSPLSGIAIPSKRVSWRLGHWKPSETEPVIEKIADQINRTKENYPVSKMVEYISENTPKPYKFMAIVASGLLFEKGDEKALDPNIENAIQAISAHSFLDQLTQLEKTSKILIDSGLAPIFDSDLYLKDLLISNKAVLSNLITWLLEDPAVKECLPDVVDEKEVELFKLDITKRTTDKTEIINAVRESVQKDIDNMSGKRSIHYSAVEPLRKVSAIALYGKAAESISVEKYTKSIIKALNHDDLNMVIKEVLNRNINNVLPQLHKKPHLVNHPSMGALSSILFTKKDGYFEPSEIATLLAKSVITSDLIKSGLSYNVNFNHRPSYDNGYDIAQMVSPLIQNLVSSLKAERGQLNRPEHIQQYADAAKDSLRAWVEKMDEISADLTPSILRYAQYRTVQKDAKGSLSASIREFNESIRVSAKLPMLSIALNGDILSPAEGIIQDVREAILAEKEVQLHMEQQASIYTETPEHNVQNAKMAEAQEQTDELYVSLNIKEDKPEHVPAGDYFEIINQEIKPAENGIPGKRQQLKMF